MSEVTEQGAIGHNTPAEIDPLIRAMEAAGYTYDSLESTDEHLRFFGENGQTMTMGGWQECEAWLNGVVFDDPTVSDRIEITLHPERFVTQSASTASTLRAVEDAVEQNDNSFDGIINNLPEQPPAGAPDLTLACRCASEAADRDSILTKLKEQQEQAAKRQHPPRVLHYRQDPERSLE